MVSTRATTSHAHAPRPDRSLPRNRILAIDYGRKKMGLALSDELCLTAQPLGTLNRVNRQTDLRRLRDTCRDHAVARIIVGHPLHMNGQVGEMAEEATRFATRIRKELGIEVELVDERLTSWEARQLRSFSGEDRERKRPPVDDLAAAVLLRDYLEQRNNRNAAESEKD